MKMRVSIVCAVILSVVLLFASCGNSSVAIDDKVWSFSHIQNQEGDILYVSDSFKSKNALDEAEVLDMSCNVDKNTLNVATSEREWNILYTVRDKNGDFTLYDLICNSGNGYATISKSFDDNGKNEYVMIAVLDGYALYFTAPID